MRSNLISIPAFLIESNFHPKHSDVLKWKILVMVSRPIIYMRVKYEYNLTASEKEGWRQIEDGIISKGWILHKTDGKCMQKRFIL